MRSVVAALALAMLGCVNHGAPVPPVERADTDAAPAVQIRIRNGTNVDFDSVEVRFPNQTGRFGAVAVGETSGYRRVNGAYRYAYVEARAGDKRYVVQPIDYVGESLLAEGRYTYSLEGRFADEPANESTNGVAGFMAVTLVIDPRGN
jgi:hypothetical protein